MQSEWTDCMNRWWFGDLQKLEIQELLLNATPATFLICFGTQQGHSSYNHFIPLSVNSVFRSDASVLCG